MGCVICPRGCGADRGGGIYGVCGVGDRLKVARAALHYWEEPCISGESGSGAIFFSGCALGCDYCQNREISGGKVGTEITVERLVEIFFELADKGAHNINLVTGDHFIPQIAEAITRAKSQDFNLPFIYNCSGYETVEALSMLDGLIDVYLPDFKYMESEPARVYSHAEDYPDIAVKAIEEMVRQCPKCEFDAGGIMRRGVIVRHLLLPGHVLNAKKIVKYLHEKYGNTIYISLMSQYTPMTGACEKHPRLCRRIKKGEYDRLMDYAIRLGVENAFIQDVTAAEESFIPGFDGEGVV